MSSAFRSVSRLALLLVSPLPGAILFAAGVAVAQEPGPEVSSSEGSAVDRCDGPEFREFDFWLGHWEVRSPEGEPLGHNQISRIGGGCGLLERWQGAGGSSGLSINTYEPDLDRWTQRWVGDGATLWLEGGLAEGSGGTRMVLTGPQPRVTPRGEVLDRLTWELLDDGQVRQVWEISPDHGQSWQEVFEGIYLKTSPRDAVAISRPAALEWRQPAGGAAFATVYGDPAQAGPFAFRMRMPTGFRMQPHFHNVAEHLTVLSGTLYMRFSPEGEVEELPAGSAISIPAGQPMWGWVEDQETVIQVHGVGPFRTTRLEEASPANRSSS